MTHAQAHRIARALAPYECYVWQLGAWREVGPLAWWVARHLAREADRSAVLLRRLRGQA